MSKPAIHTWYRVGLTFAKLTSSTDTISLYCTNRPLCDSAGVDYTHLPILKNISNVGVAVDQYMPMPINGSITLDCTPNSYGYERRIVDLLERYTPINQTVNIWAAQTASSDLYPVGDYSLIWVAKAKSWAFNNAELTIEIESISIDDDRLGYLITTADINYTAIQSLGAILPVVFGDGIDVPAYYLTDNSDLPALPIGSYDFGYAATRTMNAAQHDYVINNIKVADHNNEFIEVESATDTTTAISGIGHAYPGDDPGYDVGSLSGYTSLIFRFTATSSFLCCAAHWYTWLVSGYGGSLRVSIYDSQSVSVTPTYGNTVNAMGAELTSTVVELAGYSLNANKLIADFKVPCVIESGKTYWIVWETADGQDFTTAHGVQFYRDNVALTENIDENYSRGSVWVNDELTEVIDIGNYRFEYWWELYGAEFGELASTTTDQNGWQPACIRFTGGYSEDITDFRQSLIYVNVTGIKDDSAGTFTGTSSAVINNPIAIAKFVCGDYISGAWVGVDTKLSGALFSATHTPLTDTSHAYYRTFNGVTISGETRLQFLARMCRNVACKIVQTNAATTRVGLWAWGNNSASTATITDDDMILLSAMAQDRSAVVNGGYIRYNLSRIGLTKIDINREAQTPYMSAQSLNYSDPIYLGLLTSLSELLYGKRILGDSDFDCVTDAVTAASLAQYYARVYQHPHQYISIRLPFWRWRHINIMDVVTIQSALLPSFFGTSAAANLPSCDGEETQRLMSGRDVKRFTTYRGQVTAYQQVLSMSEVPTLELTIRLLINPHDPT